MPIAVALTLLLAPAARALSPDAAEAERLRFEAQDALSAGEDRAAADKAAQAIAADPSSAKAYNVRAIAHQKLRDYTLELDDAEAGLRAAPRDLALLNTKATVLNRLKRFREALAAADAAVAAAPTSYYAHFMRAQAYAGLEDRDGMLAELRATADLNPKYYGKLQEALQIPKADDAAYLFAPKDRTAPQQQAGTGLWFPFFVILAVGAGSAGTLVARRTIRLTGSAPPAAPDAAPPMLSGKYRTLRKIGAGGMGVVYEAVDESLGRRVAIKKMRDEIRADPKERARFLAEAKLVAGLHHPNIVDIYAVVENGDDVFLVFEYAAGKTIAEEIARGRIFSLWETAHAMDGVAAGVDYAHARRVIHRDLKPNNIMLGPVPKVMDFGVARLTQDALTRTTQSIVGTPAYMAPEQEQGVVKAESDVFSLGVCAYEMLCGALPFGGIHAGMSFNKLNKTFVPASKMNASLPPGIDAVFDRALEPDPKRRLRTARELADALARLA